MKNIEPIDAGVVATLSTGGWQIYRYDDLASLSKDEQAQWEVFECGGASDTTVTSFKTIFDAVGTDINIPIYARRRKVMVEVDAEDLETLLAIKTPHAIATNQFAIHQQQATTRLADAIRKAQANG